jgi:hypothetical protein
MPITKTVISGLRSSFFTIPSTLVPISISIQAKIVSFRGAFRPNQPNRQDQEARLLVS